MSKLKTNSSAKKRFKITASGKITYKKIGKRHGMVKRSNSQIRDLRKSGIVSDADKKNVLRHLLPYG
jgi:large subunit ribosomal protein L35